MKTKLLTAFYLALLAIPCAAQHKMDSLWSIWKDHNQTKEVRLESINKYAEEILKTDPDSALVLAEMAYQYSGSKGYEKQRSFIKTIMGSALNRKGNYENSYKRYKEALELARRAEDSTLAAISLFSLGVIHSTKGEYNQALDYYDKSLIAYENSDDQDKMSYVFNSIGIIHIIKGEYEKATENLNKSIALAEESGNLESLGGSLTNLAILKTRQGNYTAAIELYSKSLSINEQLEDEFSMGFTYSNLANLYFNQEDYAQFFENMNKSLKIRRKLGDKKGIAKCQGNLGVVYSEMGNHAEALEAFNECLAISEEIGDKKSIAHSFVHIGLIELDEGNHDTAFEHITKSLAISTELDNQLGIGRAQKALGDYYQEIGNPKRAIEYYLMGLAIAKETDIVLTRNISSELYQVYASVGNNKKAFDIYKLFISSRDSIANEENQKEIIRQQFKYEYEKQAVADSISFANRDEIQKTKLSQARNQRFSLVIVLVIVLGSSGILYSRMRLINKQKGIIEHQNQELTNLNDNLEQKIEERTQKIVEINRSLEESDERYTLALEASNDGIWDYNVREEKILFSPAIYTMLGYEPNEFPQTREGIYNLMHPEDSRSEKRKAHNLFTRQDHQDGLLDEYRLIRKDQRIIWVQVKGKIVERDEHNRPIRIVGTHSDITADKIKSQELLETVLKTEDVERSRISKDLHDGLQQTLTISSLNFQNLKKDLKGLSSKTLAKFDQGWKYLQDSIKETRSVAHTLMPKEIVDFGILSAFENTTDVFNRSHENTRFHFSHNLKTERLSNQQIEITLYRILQEAINNINKYAKASNVYIQLKEYEDIFMLTIEDDGQGFDAKKQSLGMGFKSMKNRLEAINGFLEIDSVIGQGTTILVEIHKKQSYS